jgi:hypothetical protein
MSITTALRKSYLNDIINYEEIELFEKTKKSLIYKNNNNDIYIVTNDLSKMLYYSYGHKHKYKHMPKIHAMLYDWKNELYLINREILYPCTSTKKLAELNKMELMIKDRTHYNELTKELLEFYNHIHWDYNIDFDFSPHWIMQTKSGKLVVADAFQANPQAIMGVCK